MIDYDSETWYTRQNSHWQVPGASSEKCSCSSPQHGAEIWWELVTAWSVHQTLRGLGKVAPLDIYFKVVREKQIPNVNIVINVAQSVPQQPTHGNMVIKYHLPTPGKVAVEGEATRQVAAFMYHTMCNMLYCKFLSQEKGAKLFDCQYT